MRALQTFHATLQIPFGLNKLGKLMEINGTALAPGIYTGIDGKTIEYLPALMADIVNTAPGKPIICSHTKKEGDKETLVHFSAGFFSESYLDGQDAKYKGYLYNPDAFELVEKNMVDSGSLEISVQAEFDEQRKLFVAKHATTDAMTLTDRPACKSASISDHQFVTHIKLEERKMSDDIAGLAGDDSYPMAEQTPWGKMSDKDKFQACSLFYKNKGYGAPAKQEDIDDFGYLKTLAETLGISLESYREFMKTCMAGGKSMKECADDWSKKAGKAKEELDADKKRIKDMEKVITTFQSSELERRVHEIKDIDKKFDERKLLENVSDYDAKIALLDRYLGFVTEHVPNVKLELGNTTSEPAAPDLKKEKSVFESLKLSPDLRALLEDKYKDVK